jgi:hypothetical protein
MGNAGKSEMPTLFSKGPKKAFYMHKLITGNMMQSVAPGRFSSY